jgi:hypothetical protein
MCEFKNTNDEVIIIGSEPFGHAGVEGVGLEGPSQRLVLLLGGRFLVGLGSDEVAVLPNSLYFFPILVGESAPSVSILLMSYLRSLEKPPSYMQPFAQT